jgi:fucose 4-O-acetylase-like acetyltransferase
MVDTANAEAQKPARRRVPYWDNVRFACIVLVVAGHGIQRLTYDSDWALTVYLAIYAFHMPAFAVVSGYFSKSEPPGRRQMSRVITDIILPYIIFESVWTLVQFAVEGKGNINPTQPSWTLWFLLALGIFRLVLPYLALIRWPVFWSIAISVGVGYLDNVDSTFSLSRTLGILPFFVIGWRLRTTPLADRWHAASRGVVVGVRTAAVALFVLTIGVFWTGIDLWRRIDLRFWFFYDDSYKGLGEDQWWAGGVRLGLIVIALLLVAALFSLVPRREAFFTTFGQYTMYAYLLHSFVLYPARRDDDPPVARRHAHRVGAPDDGAVVPPRPARVPATRRTEAALVVLGQSRPPARRVSDGPHGFTARARRAAVDTAHRCGRRCGRTGSSRLSAADAAPPTQGAISSTRRAASASAAP